MGAEDEWYSGESNGGCEQRSNNPFTILMDIFLSDEALFESFSDDNYSNFLKECCALQLLQRNH